jgi:cupin fold WbuC family metalloprotein
MIKKYSVKVLNDLTTAAKATERKRINLNIHESTEAAVQRLFLAVEPETYIRPHRHPQAHKWELFVVLDGEMDLLLFNDLGDIVNRIALSATTTRAVEIPANTWHSYISKKSGTLALEIKEGAYLPSPEEDFLSMSPAENTDEAAAYLQWMKNE